MSDELLNEVIEAPEVETKAFDTEKSESIEDTVRRSIEEIKGTDNSQVPEQEAESDIAEEAGEKPSDEEKSEAAKILAKGRKVKAKKVAALAEQVQPEVPTAEKEEEPKQETPKAKLDAPARWSVEKKEWFNRQPREVQEEVSRGWSEIESHTTKLWQDLQREKSQSEGINRIVAHYMPKWGIAGLTPEQAIAELCAAQDLIQQNPLEAYDRLLAKSGVTPQQVHEYRQNRGQNNQVSQVSKTSENNLTRQDILSIIQEWNQSNSQQRELYSAADEIRQVQREVGPDGRYVYPELHDSQYLERVKPLVEDVKKTQPTLSWAEATKRAINTLRILDGKVGSPSLNDPRLSRRDEIAKVKAASVSIRGRGNGAIPQVVKAKKGESVEESVRKTMAMLSQH